MSICPHPAQAVRQGLPATVLGQDSACHRRFRSKAIDWNLRFPVAERYTRARKARRVRCSMKNGGLHGF